VASRSNGRFNGPNLADHVDCRPIAAARERYSVPRKRLLSLRSSIHKSTYLVCVSSIYDYDRAIARGRCLIAKRFLCPPSVLTGDRSWADRFDHRFGLYDNRLCKRLQTTRQRERRGTRALRVPACVMRVTTNFGVRTWGQQSASNESSCLTVIDVVISAGHVVRTARAKGTSP
jgi:hypothetical protein